MKTVNLEIITNNTNGIPECWHIDANGKSSPEVFQKHFGLPRSMRNDKKILEIAVVRKKRLSHFMWCLLHYRHLSLPIMLTGDKSTSPEAHAMARYDEGWHLRNEEDLVEVAKLNAEDLKIKLVDLMAQKQEKAYKQQQVKVQAMANRANITTDRAYEAMCKCVIETWLRARYELSNWDQLNDEAKQLLAEVIFCGYTFFGKTALEDVAAIEPAVFAYYRTFRGLSPLSINVAALVPPVNTELPNGPVEPRAAMVPQDVSSPTLMLATIAQGATETKHFVGMSVAEAAKSAQAQIPSSPKTVVSTAPQVGAMEVGPSTLQELYALIVGISRQAQAAKDVGPEPAQMIRELLDQHLPRLTLLNARLAPEEVRALIEGYCDIVLNMAKVLEFDNSEQRDLVPVLRAAWKVTVISALEDGRPGAWFEMNLSERKQLPEFVERFEAEQARIATAIREIEEIRALLVQSKFTARASLRAKETHKNNEISSAHQEIETIRVEAAHSLVPEGRTLDELMEDDSLLQDADIEVEGFNSQAVKDFQAVVTAFKPAASAPQATSPSAEAHFEPPIEFHAVVDLTPVMPVAVVPEVAKVELAEVDAVTSEQPPTDKLDTLETSVVVLEPGVSGKVTVMPPVTVPVLVVSASVEKVEVIEQPPIVESGEVVEVPAAFGVNEALRHLHCAESKEDAQKAFRIAYDQYSQVPGHVAEAIVLHWIEVGHLNVAYQILRDANESTLLSDRVLDASLVRSAFYGMNMWPKDRDALSYIQRDLNLLNHKDLEDQLDRKPTGKLVPYLLVCATLQPALFAGGETQAATLLKLAADHFDDHLARLVTHTADFTLRGGRLDLDLLRNEQAQEVHMAVAKLQDQVNTWVELNQQRTNRWHALRLALKTCIKRPIISEAIAAVKAGEQGDSAAIRLFVNTYSVHSESRRLLDTLVEEIRSDSVVNDHIDSQAYTTFCQQMDALVSIAQAWLLEVMPADVRPTEVQEFLRKFHTLLERSIHNLESHSGHVDLEHRVGSTILLKMLRKLKAEIKNSSNDTWQFDQTDATFRLPETLARLDMGDVGVDLRLEWFAMRLTSPNWLADMLDLARRHQAHWVRLLLLRQLNELSGQRDAEIDSVSNDIAGVRADLKKTIEQFRNLSLQAMSVDIINEGEHLASIDQVNDWLEDLSDRKPYVDVSDINDEVLGRVRSMERLLNSSASQLDEELNRELLNIRIKVGQDAVPDGWDARARQALDKRNLSLVRELINQLKEHSDRNARLVETSLLDNVEFSDFLKAEDGLYTLLHEYLNPREAGDRVISERPGGLDYALHKADFKDAIGNLLEWRIKGKNKRQTLEKPTYEGIVEVLQFLGFDPVSKNGTSDVLNSCEYTSTGNFRRLKVRISRPTLPKGFPLFQGDVGSSQPLNVIFVQGAWGLSGLIDLVERHGQPDRALLMTGQPLSPEDRKAFAAFCRERKCTIFLLDPVVLSYVATARHREKMLETFLRVSAAWTYYNPYTKGDARLPAPPEMRFGRENDIASLVEPRGAALVYGGRQLGKTTLLNASVQEFKKRDPLHNHAYYIPMDGIFQHVVERGINVKKRLFELLVAKLVDSGVLVNNPSNAQMEPEDRLRQEFLRSGTTKVLFCLDEIDSVLNKDAATNFELVRSLKLLVNDPHHRFRVVLAGLNNVNRFRTYPNVPLEQLGSPLEVGILSSQDARSLILQPLTALGYRFKESELVDRIMAYTNRHPSLLHIFCSELVEQLARDRNREDGLRLILQTDIENIENSPDVRRLSGDRFDMTLNLDKRYTVAVYGLIAVYDKGIGKFTVGKALEVARGWVPEEFEQMSESGFESLLLELVGLGVLRVADKAKRQYALRNQSILQLIGSMDDIQHKLQDAMNDLKKHDQDVLTCHATGPAPNHFPSPLSLQDEHMILSAKAPEGAPKYSVSLILGTPAQGLTLKDMQEGFNTIYEFQSGSSMSKYDTQVVTNAATMELKRFSEIVDTAIDSWATTKSAVMLVSLEDCSSIDRIMDLISIANEKASRATRLKHSLRLVFLLGARAMWSWHAHSWITASPSEIGGQVELGRWTRHACEGLLDQQGMSVTSEQGEMLRCATEGWYVSLMKFIEVRKKKESASSFNDFSRIFKPLAELPPKDFEKFLKQSGMNSVEWSMPLAGKLKEFEALDEFSKEDLQTAIEFMGEEHEFLISPEQSGAVVRWWTALRVIEVNTREKSKAVGKEGKVTYCFIPSIQRAIVEYVNQAGAREVVA